MPSSHGMKPSILLLIKVVPVLVAIYFIFYILSPTLATLTPLIPKPAPTDTTTFKNVAAIIEDRPLSNLVPHLLHFSSVLGPDWPIVLFNSGDNFLRQSPPFQRAIDQGRIIVRALPEGTQFNNHAAVSELLTAPWFWEQLAPAGHVFLFQADSIVCANSHARIDDFLQYDFIGAPIDVPIHGDAGHGEGYNGGFSLRNRSMMLDLVNTFSWQGEKDEGIINQDPCVTKIPCLKFEDQWFYHKMKSLPGVKLPDKDVAAAFAVETIWNDAPFGYHQVERWNSDRMDKVMQWCPEYKLATTDLLVKHSKEKVEVS